MDDSLWDDDPHYNKVRETEWAKISNDFTNAGYREGITAGKESALQEGFDEGFAEIGVPLGREVGRARGIAAALVGIMSTRGKDTSQREVARELLDQLNRVRFSDIAPRDLQAEEHALEHEGLGDKRKMEELDGLERDRERVAGVIEQVEELGRLINQ